MVQKMKPDGTPYNLLERHLKQLGLTMLLFAIYDLLVALAGFFFSSSIIGWLGGGIAREPFFFWALLHLILPCFCILAWMDTKRNIVIVAGAILARVVYGVAMLIYVLAFGAHMVWAVLGGISLFFALIHYVLLRLSDFGLWEVFRRAGNPPGMRWR